MAAKKRAAAKTVAKPTAQKNGKSLETETDKNVKKIVDIEAQQKLDRTVGAKISEGIAIFCGSMTFVWVHVAWFGAWILLNSVFGFQFDPFPYTFLTLVVSLEAIFLSTFILISQNHETLVTERRNHLDLQINMLAEQENTKMLELLGLIAEKVGVSADDPAMDILKEEIDPKTLVEQIMSAKSDDPKNAKTPDK